MLRVIWLISTFYWHCINTFVEFKDFKSLLLNSNPPWRVLKRTFENPNVDCKFRSLSISLTIDAKSLLLQSTTIQVEPYNTRNLSTPHRMEFPHTYWTSNSSEQPLQGIGLRFQQRRPQAELRAKTWTRSFYKTIQDFRQIFYSIRRSAGDEITSNITRLSASCRFHSCWRHEKAVRWKHSPITNHTLTWL